MTEIHLSGGSHASPDEGFCFMEAVSILAGETFSSRPSCVHPVLATASIEVNDRLSDGQRHLLVGLFGRVLGTGAAQPETPMGRCLLNARLAGWFAKTAARTLELYAQDTPGRDSEASWPHARAKHAAKTAATYATQATKTASERLSDSYTQVACRAAAKVESNGRVGRSCLGDRRLPGWFTDLLDYYDELTGHVPREVSRPDLRLLLPQ